MNPILQAVKTQTNAIPSNKNASSIFSMMMQNNPQFRQFMNANAGKTPEQVARENGIDMGMLNALMK